MSRVGYSRCPPVPRTSPWGDDHRLASSRSSRPTTVECRASHQSEPASVPRKTVVCSGLESPRSFSGLPKVEAGSSPATRVSKGKGNEGKDRKRPLAQLPTWALGFWAKLGAGLGFLLWDTWRPSCVPTEDPAAPRSPSLPGQACLLPANIPKLGSRHGGHSEGQVGSGGSANWRYLWPKPHFCLRLRACREAGQDSHFSSSKHRQVCTF